MMDKDRELSGNCRRGKGFKMANLPMKLITKKLEVQGWKIKIIKG